MLEIEKKYQMGSSQFDHFVIKTTKQGELNGNCSFVGHDIFMKM